MEREKQSIRNKVASNSVKEVKLLFLRGMRMRRGRDGGGKKKVKKGQLK